MNLFNTFRPLSPLLSAALLGAACGPSPRDAAARSIAEVAGRPIALAEFQPVLERRLEDLPGEASDVVKSRLLDQFLDERVLQEEARRRGIRADDLEVARALAGLSAEAGPAAPSYREDVRSTLTVEKLLRTTLEELASVTPEEESTYYDRHQEQFRRPAAVMVRQILLDDAEAAAEARALLEREPDRFPELASERSVSADGGRRIYYTVADLPEEVAAELGKLSEGEISPVIPMGENQLILLMEESREERRLSLEEARPEIHLRLLERRGNGAMARLLADLRRRLGVVVYRQNLPFTYVEEPA